MQEIAIYNAQKVKYQTDSDNIAIAQSQAYAKKQEDMNLARGAAQLKYEGLYKQILKDSEASNLIASGVTGRSVDRLKTMEYADYGRKVNAIGRKIMMDDIKLERQTSAEVSKLQGFREQAYANIAFNPVPDVAPPQPVMQSVGAQAFMQALSIAASVATAGGSGGFNWFGPESSDRRLKENIKKIGESISGLGIYTFNYIGHATKYIGAMADEVLKVKPEAVTVRDGYLAVYYDMIDVNFEVVK